MSHQLQLDIKHCGLLLRHQQGHDPPKLKHLLNMEAPTKSGLQECCRARFHRGQKVLPFFPFPIELVHYQRSQLLQNSEQNNAQDLDEVHFE
jgi:hypothetical protein